jgi:hypothetical protein
MCSQIERKEKFMVPKFDNLQKHAKRWKWKKAKPYCAVG